MMSILLLLIELVLGYRIVEIVYDFRSCSVLIIIAIAIDRPNFGIYCINDVLAFNFFINILVLVLLA